jgi:hypothetical protein
MKMKMLFVLALVLALTIAVYAQTGLNGKWVTDPPAAPAAAPAAPRLVVHPVALPVVAVVEGDVVVAEAEVAVVAVRRVWTLPSLAAKSPAQCSKVVPTLKSRKAQRRISRRSGTRFAS